MRNLDLVYLGARALQAEKRLRECNALAPSKLSARERELCALGLDLVAYLDALEVSYAAMPAKIARLFRESTR